MRMMLLLGWVFACLLGGTALVLAGAGEAADLVWTAGAVPVAVRVAVGLLAALRGGRVGVDAIALAAIEMAMAGVEFAIPADEVIDTMGEIGAAMDVRYRETAGGGLAATPTGRRLAKERLVELKRAGG